MDLTDNIKSERTGNWTRQGNRNWDEQEITENRGISSCVLEACSSYRLRLLGDTAVEAQPEFTHDWQTVLKRLCARGPGGLGSHASEVQSGLMEELLSLSSGSTGSTRLSPLHKHSHLQDTSICQITYTSASHSVTPLAYADIQIKLHY